MDSMTAMMAAMVLVGSSCRGLGEQVQLGDGEENGDLQVHADVEVLHRHAVELVIRWNWCSHCPYC